MLGNKEKKRNRPGKMSTSEIITILIHFHQSNFRTFKHYYEGLMQRYYRSHFPDMVSYPRFVAIIKSVMIPLCAFIQTLTGEKTGIYFVDSTLLKVCHIRREKQNKMFKGLAKKSKSTMGWFFGFKLHIVINDKGELMAF